MSPRGVAWRGVAWRGVAWRGVAWRGVAWDNYVHSFNVCWLLGCRLGFQVFRGELSMCFDLMVVLELVGCVQSIHQCHI
jgi:hypothetical protein